MGLIFIFIIMLMLVLQSSRLPFIEHPLWRLAMLAMFLSYFAWTFWGIKDVLRSHSPGRFGTIICGFALLTNWIAGAYAYALNAPYNKITKCAGWLSVVFALAYSWSYGFTRPIHW